MHKIVFIRAKEPGKTRLNEGVFGSYKDMTNRSKEEKMLDVKRQTVKAQDVLFQKSLKEIYDNFYNSNIKLFKSLQHNLSPFYVTLLRKNAEMITDSPFGDIYALANGDFSSLENEDDLGDEGIGYDVNDVKGFLSKEEGAITKRDILINIPVKMFYERLFEFRKNYYDNDINKAGNRLYDIMQQIEKSFNECAEIKNLYRDFNCEGRVSVKLKLDTSNIESGDLGGIVFDDYGHFSYDTVRKFFDCFSEFNVVSHMLGVVCPASLMKGADKIKLFEDLICSHIKTDESFTLSMIHENGKYFEDFPDMNKVFTGDAEHRWIYLNFRPQAKITPKLFDQIMNVLSYPFKGLKENRIDDLLVKYTGKTYNELLAENMPEKAVKKADAVGLPFEKLMELCWIKQIKFDLNDVKGTLNAIVDAPVRKSAYEAKLKK